MPYFPKEEKQIVKLAKVVYETDDKGEVVLLKGRPKVISREFTGETIEYVPKDAPVDVKRGLIAQLKASQNLGGRIESLTKKQTGDITQDEFDQIQTQIDELAQRPDSVHWMCSYVASSVRSWDYYATKADFENGSPIPLSVEAMRAYCDLDIISQVFAHIMGRDEEDQTEGKESPAVSLNGSNQKELSESVQTSTVTM